MIGKKAYEERTISNAEVKEILKKIGAEMPMNYEQKTTLDYLEKFVKLTPEEASKLIEELVRLNEKIKPEVAIKIADLMPKDENDVRAIFAKERFALSKDEVAKILEVVANYRK